MFIDEIVSKRKGKEYRTVLVRESFRVGKTVSHRTIANISQLPQGCVDEIKRYLQGKPRGVDLSQVQVLESKEYGASQSIISFARKLELERIISSQKLQWREDILALIAGKLLYSGNELSLTNLFAETVLWESCGHPTNSHPDVNKHCYKSLDNLLQKRKSIQKKLMDKHLSDEKLALVYLTSTSVIEGLENVDKSYYEDKNFGHQEIHTGLLTNSKGCPVAIGIKSKTLLGCIEPLEFYKIVDKFGLQSIVFISKGEILTKNRIQDINKRGFKTITTLVQDDVKYLVNRKVISVDQFSGDRFVEVFDPENKSLRYILGMNIERKLEKTRLRTEFIKKTEKLLNLIQKSKGLKKDDIFKAIVETFTIYNTKQFFNFEIKDDYLNYSVNQSKVLEEENYDGCYVIQTDVETEMMSKLEIVNAFQNLNPIEESFRLIETTSTEISPISLQLNNRICAHVILCLLSYYLQWHIKQKLDCLFKKNGKQKGKCSTFGQVIDRLKPIRSQTIRIGDITVNHIKSTLDEEQREIISALGVTLAAKLTK